MEDVSAWQAAFPTASIENYFNFVRPSSTLPDLYEYYDPLPYGEKTFDKIEVWRHVDDLEEYYGFELDDVTAVGDKVINKDSVAKSKPASQSGPLALRDALRKRQ